MSETVSRRSSTVTMVITFVGLMETTLKKTTLLSLGRFQVRFLSRELGRKFALQSRYRTTSAKRPSGLLSIGRFF
jgi:hypothetical protein